MYVGPGLGGRTTSLVSVLRSLGVSVSGSDIRTTKEGCSEPAEQSFELPVDGRIAPIVASVSWVRGWLWYEYPLARDLDPRILAELDLLPKCDGFIFVIDGRPFRPEADQEALERLTADLASRGRDIHDFPIVFQSNHRDVPDVAAMDWVRANFRVRTCGYRESIAPKGVGTTEAMEDLVRLVWKVRTY